MVQAMEVEGARAVVESRAGYTHWADVRWSRSVLVLVLGG